jgi:hypothetical protein
MSLQTLLEPLEEDRPLEPFTLMVAEVEVQLLQVQVVLEEADVLLLVEQVVLLAPMVV